MNQPNPSPPSRAAPIPPSTYEPEGEPVTDHKHTRGEFVLGLGWSCIECDTDTSIPGVCHICGVPAGIHTCTDGVLRLPLPLATQHALEADRVRMGGVVAPWNDIFPECDYDLTQEDDE